MNENNEKKSDNGFGKPKNGKPKFNYMWIYALLAMLIIGLQFFGSWGESPKKIGWGEVKTMVTNQDISAWFW